MRLLSFLAEAGVACLGSASPGWRIRDPSLIVRCKGSIELGTVDQSSISEGHQQKTTGPSSLGVGQEADFLLPEKRLL